MQAQNIISGETEENVWLQINEQLNAQPEILEYNVIVKQGNREISISVDIDPGGGFEGGYESTILKSTLQPPPAFTFAIHEKHFIDEIGKFFGMEDVRIGFDEFDERLIVKTSDKARVRKMFSDISLRVFFQNLHDFSLGLTKHDENDKKVAVLELAIERGVTEPHEAKNLRQR